MSNTVSDIEVKTIQGESKSLGDYQGNVLLIVNVASYCGYTSQYRGLQALHQQFQEQGFRVLGFPCNDFGAQEPGTNEEIQNFCTSNYKVAFELFDKVHAKGKNQHPLYARLTQAIEPKTDIAWNFEKFLINREGKVVARYKSSVTPSSSELIQAIENALGTD